MRDARVVVVFADLFPVSGRFSSARLLSCQALSSLWEVSRRIMTTDRSGASALRQPRCRSRGSATSRSPAETMRVLGLDRVLRAHWRRGGVLCGDSAGAHVWFEGCVTDSLGPGLRVFADGLGFAAGSCVAHFGPDRAAIVDAALRAGELPGPARGIEDGAALVVTASGAEALSARDKGGVHRLLVRNGRMDTEPMDTRRI